jgi:hypothetical protein
MLVIPALRRKRQEDCEFERLSSSPQKNCDLKRFSNPGVVVHAYNSSYSRDRGRRITVCHLPWAKAQVHI